MADLTEQTPPTIDETPISPVRPSNERKGSLDRKNSLEAHLSHRPDRAELIQKNILPASRAAPGLLAQQKALEKHMLEDKLNDKIAARPSPEELVKGGVLPEDPRTAEEKYEEAIEDEYAKREGGA